jgi:hypothetical protein
LIEAFLEREDEEFWQQWDAVVEPHSEVPLDALAALCDWVGGRVDRDDYRGCPQLNVAAEFADTEHPARKVADRHKLAMAGRLTKICARIDAAPATLRGEQISSLFDGAFMSNGRLKNLGASALLKDAVKRIIGA